MAAADAESSLAARRPSPAAPLRALAALPLEDVHFHIAGRAWTIRAVRDQDVLLKASDALGAFPFGLLLWESGPVLAEALAARPELVAKKRVLELGAGVGLSGLVARHLGAELRQTDHSPEALELCRVNAELNGITGIDLALADWNHWRDDTRYDLIIGSDVLYDRAAHGAVMAILTQNLAPGGRVLLADPGRADTPGFVAETERAGWHRTVEPPGRWDSKVVLVAMERNC